MNTLILGWGEVGGSHGRLLAEKYDVCGIDVVPDRVPTAHAYLEEWPVDVLLVAVRYSDKFDETVRAALVKHKPDYLCILTTVPPGTTRQFGERACHSTTRGLHPDLESGLREIPKHVGGASHSFFQSYFKKVGIPTIGHNRAETTEVAHILNNAAYGINVMFAGEMARLCRAYGVDYVEAVMNYTQTNNIGYERLDHPSKRRMILTPPGDKIGGHCLVQSANLIPSEKRGPMLDLLATYNERKNP